MIFKKMYNIKLHFAHADEIDFNEKRVAEGIVAVDVTTGVFEGIVNHLFVDDQKDHLVIGQVNRDKETGNSLVFTEINNNFFPVKVYRQNAGEETGSVCHYAGGRFYNEGGKGLIVLSESSEKNYAKLTERINAFYESSSKEKKVLITTLRERPLHLDYLGQAANNNGTAITLSRF